MAIFFFACGALERASPRGLTESAMCLHHRTQCRGELLHRNTMVAGRRDGLGKSLRGLLRGPRLGGLLPRP